MHCIFHSIWKSSYNHTIHPDNSKFFSNNSPYDFNYLHIYLYFLVLLRTALWGLYPIALTATQSGPDGPLTENSLHQWEYSPFSEAIDNLLHNPKGRNIPAVSALQWDWKRVYPLQCCFMVLKIITTEVTDTIEHVTLDAITWTVIQWDWFLNWAFKYFVMYAGDTRGSLMVFVARISLSFENLTTFFSQIFYSINNHVWFRDSYFINERPMDK